MEKLEDLSPPPTSPSPPPLSLPSPPQFGSSSESDRVVVKVSNKASIREISGGTFQEMKSAHGQYVLVIPRAAYQTTINEKDGKRIPKEEAICRTCYKEFEEENALKVNCACPITLIHEHCAIVWSREKGSNKCDVCGQELENIPVALLPAKDSAQRPKRKLLKKWSNSLKGRTEG